MWAHASGRARGKGERTCGSVWMTNQLSHWWHFMRKLKMGVV